MQALLQHKLLLAFSGLIVAGLLWYGLSSPSVVPNLSTTPDIEGSAKADPGIVATLLTLRAVKLDGAIFSGTEFGRLKDFSTEIVSEPVGRTNPFAPLYSPNSSTTQTPVPANR